MTRTEELARWLHDVHFEESAKYDKYPPPLWNDLRPRDKDALLAVARRLLTDPPACLKTPEGKP